MVSVSGLNAPGMTVGCMLSGRVKYNAGVTITKVLTINEQSISIYFILVEKKTLLSQIQT